MNIWVHRANVERYFKYRYSTANYPIGSLTEYFKFTAPYETQAVERDLSQMQAKVLSPIEQDIVDGKQNEFLTEVLGNSQIAAGNKQLSDRLQLHLQQNFLAKPSSQQVITALHQGASLRDAAATSSVPVEVARKVIAVM